MMAGPGSEFPAGGGLARHIPVLLREVLEAIEPQTGMVIVDGTFGAGGYSSAFLERGANVIAFDRDPQAIADGHAMVEHWGGRLRLVTARFSQLAGYLDDPVDAVVLDIGVSSMQIDEAGRGFSFRNDGPLDMRMSKAGPTAADVVNSFKPGDLARIFNFLGEERHAGRIARMIERKREERPFTTTGELAGAVEGLVKRGPKDRIHPATRVFQALRIYVNDELGELGAGLLAAEQVLKPGGILAVVSFHSLEDRVVKRFLTARSGKASGSRHLPQVASAPATFEPLGKLVKVSEEESKRNPRARSARLRAAIRTAEPARDIDENVFGLPKLPALPAAKGEHS